MDKRRNFHFIFEVVRCNLILIIIIGLVGIPINNIRFTIIITSPIILRLIYNTIYYCRINIIEISESDKMVKITYSDFFTIKEKTFDKGSLKVKMQPRNRERHTNYKLCFEDLSNKICQERTNYWTHSRMKNIVDKYNRAPASARSMPLN